MDHTDTEVNIITLYKVGIMIMSFCIGETMCKLIKKKKKKSGGKLFYVHIRVFY